MLSDIAGDVSRCISSRRAFLSGEAKQDYSSFWLQRVIDGCKEQEVSTIIPDITEKVNELQEYLDGKGDSEAILSQWKQYELLEWDPDFTRVTPAEREMLERAEEEMATGIYFTEKEVFDEE